MTGCGCQILVEGDWSGAVIEYCPLHAAAGQMRDALSAAMARLESLVDDGCCFEFAEFGECHCTFYSGWEADKTALDCARAALAAAEVTR